MESIQVEFDALAERAIPNFEPARKIWPTSIRLVMWLGIEAVVLALVALIDPRPISSRSCTIRDFSRRSAFSYSAVSLPPVWRCELRYLDVNLHELNWF